MPPPPYIVVEHTGGVDAMAGETPPPAGACSAGLGQTPVWWRKQVRPPAGEQMEWRRSRYGSFSRDGRIIWVRAAGAGWRHLRRAAGRARPRGRVTQGWIHVRDHEAANARWYSRQRHGQPVTPPYRDRSDGGSGPDQSGATAALRSGARHRRRRDGVFEGEVANYDLGGRVRGLIFASLYI